MAALALQTAVLLDSPPLDVFGQMALDEAILDTPGPGFTLRFFRWAAGSRPSVTFGYFQRYEEIVKAAKGQPLVRRPTGGGIVHHVDDVTFSVTFTSDGSLSPQAVYKNIHRGVHVGLKAAKIKTALWSPPGWRDKAPQCETRDACECFVAPEPMDLVWSDDSKVLGGALRRRAGRFLYQGSLQLPAAAHPGPSGHPSRGAGRDEVVERAVRSGLEGEFSISLPASGAPEALIKEAAARREKFLSEEWNRKR